MMTPGLTHTSSLLVTEEKTARKIGSGDLAVLATPAMLALMENAAMLAVAKELPEGSTTVGAQIASTHLLPTAIGRVVKATALLTDIEGRKLTFTLSASDDEGHLLGEGTHTRYIVDCNKFMSKL